VGVGVIGAEDEEEVAHLAQRMGGIMEVSEGRVGAAQEKKNGGEGGEFAPQERVVYMYRVSCTRRFT
jgi:hypothetical protein